MFCAKSAANGISRSSVGGKKGNCIAIRKGQDEKMAIILWWHGPHSVAYKTKVTFDIFCRYIAPSGVFLTILAKWALGATTATFWVWSSSSHAHVFKVLI